MKKIITLILAVAMLLSMAVGVSAAVTKGQMFYLPGTEDDVSNMPEDADLSTEFVVSERIPQRDGYEFLYWELDYDVFYKVTYVVNPDLKFGTPEDSTVPTDPTEYYPGQMVDVANQLTTDVGYAYNKNGDKVTGTWTFTPWDKDDFEIHEDTTITGGWTFTANEPVKYTYTVHYLLWEAFLKGKETKVAKAETRYIDQLGITVTEYAKPMDELNKPYSIMNKKTGAYNYRIVTPYRTQTIHNGGDKIIIFYEEIPKGM